MTKDYLAEAGNVHLAYYVEAADKLGIQYEIIVRSLMARFSDKGKHWFILNTALPVNNVPSTTISKRKNLAYKVLKVGGIPVAEQREINNEEEAIDFWKEFGNIVLKPVQNLGGNGVSLLPKSEHEVRHGFQTALATNLSSTNVKVLAEEFCTGTNYRILVCDDKVIGAVRRRAAYIVGDGSNTIEQLIISTNQQRKDRLLKPIRLDKEVEKRLWANNLTLDSIPQRGEEVEVRLNSNQSTGGTTEECLDEIDPYYLDLAIKATQVLGLKVGGVDLIAEDVTKQAPCVINEINYNPGLRVHYKADKGKIVDVATPIMQYIRENI